MRLSLPLAAMLSFVATVAQGASEAEELFVSEVWPLLETQCVKCHGPEKQKGDLRLDSRVATLKGGENGPAMVVGKPAESLMIKLVHHADKDRTMPPKEKLKPAEIAVLERWIEAGAPWPAIPAATPVALKTGEKLGDMWNDPRNPIVRIFHGERRDLWSLRPLQNDPAATNSSNIIDTYLPSAGKETADRRTLARRLYFDLIGLPPTPEQMAEYLADTAPDAYEGLVDRLLASPEYGVHWARLWLDAVRYSDSNGFDWDEYRPLAWRFRDYVVRSLNCDKPFDRFVREQIAGDELVLGAPRDAAEQDALIATGFLRLGPWDNSAGGFGEQERVRQQLLNDLVETTGAAFLGLSLSCARCHDHKTDPISQADYYRLRAFFEGVKFRDDLALDLEPEQKAIATHNATIEQELEAARKIRTETLAPAKARLRKERLEKLPAEEQQLLAGPAEGRDEADQKKAKEIERKLEVSDDDARKILGEEGAKAFSAADAKVQEIRKKQRAFMVGLCATDAEEPPKPTRILYQGNLTEPREEVVPGFLSALDPNGAAIPECQRPKSTGRRTALANWIVSTANPLTSRVIVNRVWQGHFGAGLVSTTNDFGFAGARPQHPELLDALARQFVRDNWSLKRLHRTIVTSAAFRLSPSEPRRLSAEQLRDAVLAVSGLLKKSSGGPPVWPTLPEDVLKANPALLDDNKEKTKGWYPSPAEQLQVRSIYLIQKRTVRVPFMEIFDLPDNAVPCARRTESTVAPQALALLNDPFTAECAMAFASRVEREAGGGVKPQINRAFQLCFQREPDEFEMSACLKLREQRSLAELCRALLNLNEFIYLD